MSMCLLLVFLGYSLTRKHANSKDNEFEFLFGIVGFWFYRNTTDAVRRWVCGFGKLGANCSITCPILVTFVHFGRGSVSEGLSGNHQNIECELHS